MQPTCSVVPRKSFSSSAVHNVGTGTFFGRKPTYEVQGELRTARQRVEDDAFVFWTTRYIRMASLGVWAMC